MTATFTREGARRGMRLAAPILPGILAAGLLYGALCRAAAVSVSEAALKSSLVAAGTAQFAVLEVWSRPAPFLAVTSVVLLVNLRYVLMGAALPAWFANLPPSRRAFAAFFLSDESWALSARDFGQGRTDAAVLVGSGAALYASWALGTVGGWALAAGLPVAAVPGLGFLVPAALLAVLAGFWSGPRRSLGPWLAAAAVALAAAELLPGSWYIVAGGLAGMLAGGMSDVA